MGLLREDVPVASAKKGAVAITARTLVPSGIDPEVGRLQLLYLGDVGNAEASGGLRLRFTMLESSNR